MSSRVRAREAAASAARSPLVRWTSIGGLVFLAAVVALVAPRVLDRGGGAPERAASAPIDGQRVATWVLLADGGRAFLVVFGAGEKPPVAVAVPGEVTINLPGQNLGTLAEAGASGDAGLVQVAVENLLGVRVDATSMTGVSELAATVDGLGGIEVRGDPHSGAEAVAYLTATEAEGPADAAFLRWQDILEGLLPAMAEGDGSPPGVPEPVAQVALAEGTAPALVALPVVDLGAGLLRPDPDAVETLVRDRFVPAADEGIRLVVLNGVGTPGIGEDVARVLVPEGFRLVASGNANTFDLKVTRIIASSREDLAAAERARGLLRVGEVQLGEQPAGLADVTVVVGEDFGGS